MVDVQKTWYDEYHRHGTFQRNTVSKLWYMFKIIVLFYHDMIPKTKYQHIIIIV